LDVSLRERVCGAGPPVAPESDADVAKRARLI